MASADQFSVRSEDLSVFRMRIAGDDHNDDENDRGGNGTDDLCISDHLLMVPKQYHNACNNTDSCEYKLYIKKNCVVR